MLANVPRNWLLEEWENVREYPQKNHWKVVTQSAMIDAQSNDKACFFLERPEYKSPTPGTMIHTSTAEVATHTMLEPSNWALKSTVKESPPVPVPVAPSIEVVDIFSD